MPNFYNNNIKYANPPAGGCNWDWDYYRSNYINATLLTQILDGNYIKSGLVPSIGAGLNVDYTAGVAVVNGSEFSIVAGSALMVSAPIAGVEINILYVNSSGSLVVIQDDPPEGAEFAALAIVDTDDTTITRMIDARHYIAPETPETPNPNKNVIINGNFDIWQRANSQTTAGYWSDDRWTNIHLGSAKTHSKQTFALGQTDVPNNPKYYSRTATSSVAGSGNYVIKKQSIEKVLTFSGESATLSFWAKADTAKNIAIEFSQNFGNGGAPSTTVEGIESQLIALTTSWTKYEITVDIPSITGKVLGDNLNDHLALYFWFDAGSSFDSRTASLGQQSGTFDIAQIQLEKGSVATEFDDRCYHQELALCQPYYQIAFIGAAAYALSGGTIGGTIGFPVTMRADPVITQLQNNVGFSQANVTSSTSLYVAKQSQVFAYRISSTVGASQFFEIVACESEI